MIHWRQKARCKDMDVELFFPTDGVDADGFEIDDYTDEAVDEARITCDTCPVLKQCLLTNWLEPAGVFGGTTPKERGFDSNGQRVRKVPCPVKKGDL